MVQNQGKRQSWPAYLWMDKIRNSGSRRCGAATSSAAFRALCFSLVLGWEPHLARQACGFWCWVDLQHQTAALQAQGKGSFKNSLHSGSCALTGCLSFCLVYPALTFPTSVPPRSPRGTGVVPCVLTWALNCIRTVKAQAAPLRNSSQKKGRGYEGMTMTELDLFFCLAPFTACKIWSDDCSLAGLNMQFSLQLIIYIFFSPGET